MSIYAIVIFVLMCPEALLVFFNHKSIGYMLLRLPLDYLYKLQVYGDSLAYTKGSLMI